MAEEIVAHLVFDVPRSADEDPALQVEEHPFERRRSDQQEPVLEEDLPGDGVGQLVDRVADDHRLDERETRGTEDAQAAEGQRGLVPAEIREEPPQRSHEPRIVSNDSSR